jgi:hypothetical protein
MIAYIDSARYGIEHGGRGCNQGLVLGRSARSDGKFLDT